MRRLRVEEGFTMIELVIAIFITTIMIGALSVLFINGNHNSFANQREFTQGSLLQRQIEKVRQTFAQYGFSGIALTSSPSALWSSPPPINPTNPDDFVSGSGCSETFQVESNYNNTGEAFPATSAVADNPEPLLVNGCTVSSNLISGGQLSPVQYVDLTTGATYASQSGVPAADPYGTIYTFVTQTTTVGCNSPGGCTGDARRVIVAVVLNQTAGAAGTQYPAYSTTILTNPVASNAPGSLQVGGTSS